MENFNKDRELLEGNRKNPLKDDSESGLQVTADLREQINKKLIKKLEDQNIAQKICNAWDRGNSDRAEWLRRNQEYLMQLDEFIDPIYDSTNDWSSTLHMPTLFTVVKTYHARMLAALLGVDPFFTVKARKERHVEQEMLVQDLMRYTFKDWANEYQGVDETFDRWIWDWVAYGCGLLKARWSKKFTRFVDVESQVKPGPTQIVLDENGEPQIQPTYINEDVEVERTIECFNGPMIEHINIQDLLIVGGKGDPQAADFVIQQQYLVASDLWMLADQKIFNKDAVEETIRSGEDKKTSEQANAILQTQRETSGNANVDKDYELDKYQILEAYLKVDVDGSGINSDIVVWIHKDSRALLRATYLYRVSPSGKRPFFKIDFHKRNNTEYGVGLTEILWSISKEIDAMHNTRIDIGILTSYPFGFYRPTASMSEEKLPIEPGSMIPLDNPGQDVYFPNLGNRTAFGFQEEAALYEQIERVTSLSDISYGLTGSQGASRTATGTQALIGEANANLDVYLRRMNKGVKQLVVYIFGLLQQKLPEGFEFRTIGSDGKTYWRQIESKEQLYGMYDFELEANSANSNKQVQIQTADFIYQALNNPLLLQSGIVNQGNIYEAIKQMFQVRGIRDVSKYITKPEGYVHRYLPIEIANRILGGMDVKLDPTQDLQGFIALAEEFLTDDNLNGQLNEGQIQILASKMQEAQQLLQALEAAAAQQRNMQQMQMNQQQASAPSQQLGAGASPNEALPE